MMTSKSGGMTCVVGCWLIGVLAGVLTAAMLMAIGGFGFSAAAFFGLIVFFAAGVFTSWAFCGGLPALGEASAPSANAPSVSTATASASSAAVADSATAPVAPSPSAAPVAPPEAAPAPEKEPTPKAAPAATDAPVATEAAPAAEPKAAPTPPAAKKPDAPTAVEDVAGKPQLLSAAREGGPDDLKQIKGVGTVMEDMMHDMGVFHFDQVASWSAAEVSWVDRNLPKFKGRVSRDNWVEQAKVLAAGGETEFSKKVEKGGVY